MAHTLEVSRLIIGLLMTAIVLVFAAKRVLWLTKLIRSGQKTLDENGRKNDLQKRITTQITEVFGQTRLLRWSVPGIAHFFTMWGFFVLASVYLEAYGVLFDPEFHIPFIGRWPVLGFLQDFFAVAVLLGIIVFAIIRVVREPKKIGRDSRFYGSHTGGAWEILFMIFLVIATYALFRGAAVNTLGERFPYQSGAFFSDFMAWILRPLGATANMWIETVALMGHIGVMLVFLLIVLHSKHLHIGLAPINVTFKRLPNGLGPLLPMESNGEYIDFEDPAEDAVFGKGKIEDFTWKGYLDFTTCTECGRCQSQCPAWNTGKPLSPKLVIMNLRDHMFAKAPYILGEKPSPLESTPEGGLGEKARGEKHEQKHAHDHVPESGFERILGSGPEQALRPLVGTEEQGGVIDPDVLWSCTNCGACVEQCPVDIEHIDHIVDMRRYQVMVESEFPGELGVLFKNLETKGNPWGQNAKDRTNWIDEVDFDVPVYGEDVDSFDGFEYLFWVGCAGAYEDRAKKTTKAVAELLATAGVKFLVLGTGETCTGDSARRSGNEFLFQQLAAQNVETINELFEGVETVDRKIVVTCPHCFNTIGREYPQLGANYSVVHHTQLLNRLVRDKKLVPVKSVSEQNGQPVTYHDPCFLGRHNKVYEAPRELVEASGVTLKEMPRHADRGLCCGAGGARMWMEEHIGKRVNVERTEEAMDTASTIATGCPFCRVMITDGVDDVAASRNVEKAEVLDVAQLLLNSLDTSKVTLPEKGTAAKESEKRAAARAEAEAKAEAAAPPVEEAAPEAEAPAAPAAGGAEAKPVTGLGMAGAAKRPGAKKAAPAAEASAAPAAAPAPAKGLGLAGGAKRPGAKKAAAPAAEAPAAPASDAPPVKGLGLAGGAKRPGAKKTAAAAPAEKPAATEAPEASATPAAPAAPVKGLGLAAGAKRPGAKKTAAAPAEKPAAAETEAPAPAETAAPAEPAKPEPPVVGLGIAAGARRPGAKKAAAKPAAAPAPAAEKPAEQAAEPEKPAEKPAEPEKPEPPVVGLGIKPGAKRPGKR
ncbi:Fe-S oxidoreductase [Mycolicibacterium smegmatis]|uniref:Iron-sulfur-binding reductase n=4 Tax=Mycolicibacterium smegmatis TaxID=1772 RepID=I7FE09_MYCS2|nr:iron-sulfur cluster-binding protein [Mycolicibacterium smegmatis MC2 155]AIU12579.1 Fe-S oxidoreductase [Mycolicibacterium smegmatis]AFP37153.1 putative iron-sulfur-binding reductase [Mycolicibacterium smegmatis MC2 155]AIU05954.1 Fe-S oxidoreductase [Mycolicibacterium smegmatis MC2 155]AIU19203.1 Fe-S oxidoreductase [Mycolicibacterium smegmatis]